MPARQVMEDRLAAVQREMEQIAGELKALKTPGSADPALLAVRKLTESSLLGQRAALQKEEVQLQLDLINLQVQPTEVITPAQLQPQAVEPRFLWYGTLGTVLGLILGCCAAFIWEFLVQVRRQLPQTATP
jgi:uncharacterized protein involved in exopolysaccharide biosynthesis